MLGVFAWWEQHSTHPMLRLQVFENLDYEGIATRLGVPIGTVRSRLAKARDLLWSAMKEEKDRQPI